MTTYKRAVTAIVATLILLLLSTTTATAAPPPRSIDAACPAGVRPAEFDDVGADNVHARAIDCILFWGVTTGAGENHYQPVDTVSRAQMASFVARLITESGGNLPDGAPNAFSDDDGDTHEASINKLAAAGIVLGKSAGGYDPGGPVTRGQMATYLVRAYEQRTGTSLASTADHFPDDNGDSHEASINKAAEPGIASGYANGSYGSGNLVLRDQMASFLARLLDLLVTNDFATLPPAQPVYLGYDLRSVDNSVGDWSAKPVNVNGQPFDRALVDGHTGQESSFIEFDLSRDYVRFTAVLGLGDDSNPDQSTRFEVFGDGQRLFDRTIGFGESVPIELDVDGILRIRLSAVNLASNGSLVHIAYPTFADPAVFTS